MKKLLLSFLFVCGVLTAAAQDYNIVTAGQGAGGNYLVKVTVAMKGKEKGQDAEAIVKRCAVHGVMFRGLMAADGFAQQKPLIGDANVETTKSEWFKAFFDSGAYKTYVTIVNSSLLSTKLGKKDYELSAILTVNKEALLKYLQDEGIVKGFSNLW